MIIYITSIHIFQDFNFNFQVVKYYQNSKELIQINNNIQQSKMLRNVLGDLHHQSASSSSKPKQSKQQRLKSEVKTSQRLATMHDQMITPSKLKTFVQLLYSDSKNPQNFVNHQSIITHWVQQSINANHIKKIKNSQQKFYDQTFPPNKVSLFGEYKQTNRFDKVTWARITDLYSNPKIISKQINPSDINQGIIGDCYFLAAISALAEKQNRIKSLFTNYQSMTPNLNFQVKILYQGKWVLIDIDQWFPVQKEKHLAFARTYDQQLWPAILEKAWAKLYTSYLRTEGGFPSQVLHDLTGAPCKLVMVNKQSYQQSWNYLWDASIREYAMVAASNSGSDTSLSPVGIAQGHAYTLLNATYLRIGKKYERVVQLRNPWGNTQAKTSLGDSSDIWNQVSVEQKKRIGYQNRNPQDGIFFMYYDRFVDEFEWVQVAEVEDKGNYIHLSTVDATLKGVYYRLKISKKGVYTLLVDKPPMRGFPQKMQSFYSYPLTQIKISDLSNGKMQFIDQKVDNQRTTFIKRQLNQGIYIVKVKISYNRLIQKDFFVNLAVYSINLCQIEWASTQQATKFQGRKVDWDGKMQQKKQHEWVKGGNIDYMRQKKRPHYIEKDIFK